MFNAQTRCNPLVLAIKCNLGELRIATTSKGHSNRCTIKRISQGIIETVNRMGGGVAYCNIMVNSNTRYVYKTVRLVVQIIAEVATQLATLVVRRA